MMPELKPCPKCKHWSRLIDCGASDDEALWHAECMNIGCQYTNLFESGDKERVRTAWNDLPRPDGGDSLREALENCVKALEKLKTGHGTIIAKHCWQPISQAKAALAAKDGE